jgi:hypothetical protein
MPVAGSVVPAVAADTVRGRVVNPEGIPMARRRVVLGGVSTLTDADGAFEFRRVPKSYDVRVAVSVYLGLTRRDPVLVVRDSDGRQSAWRYRASLADGVSTRIAQHEGTWAKRVSQFLSPRGWPWIQGNQYRAMEVDWRGGDILTVTLIGYGAEENPWASAYLASSRLSLADGDTVAASPMIHKISSGRIAGKARTRGAIWPSSSE